jgi:hypothetical protein
MLALPPARVNGNGAMTKFSASSVSTSGTPDWTIALVRVSPVPELTGTGAVRAA